MNEPKLLSVAIFDPITLPDKIRWGPRRVLFIELLPPNTEFPIMSLAPPADDVPPHIINYAHRSIRYLQHSIRFSLYERGHIIARYTIHASCSLSDKKRAFATAVYPLSVSDDPPRPPAPKEIASLGQHK